MERQAQQVSGGASKQKGKDGKKPGPQYWKRSHQDTSHRKQGQPNKRSKKDDHDENGDQPDSDVEIDEELAGDSQPKYEDRKLGSYDYDLLKQSAEYTQLRSEIDGPKRKYAVCFSYLGSNYQGLQINPGCRSVEAELERALFLAGCVSDCNFGNLHKLQWTRAARTDKGVHAIGQCCAMKIAVPQSLETSDRNVAGKQLVVDKINSFLPLDIRVMTVSKVTKNFNAKIACSKRRYHYLLPTYLFAQAQTITEALYQQKLQQGNTARDVGRAGGYAEPGSTAYLSPEHLSTVRNALCANYRVASSSNNVLESFRNALQCYCGTQSFHNYTSGKTFADANARRYIMEFTCGEPFVSKSNDNEDGVEWVLLSVTGQSFLLNQIRKMIGAACEVARGAMTLEQLQQSLQEGCFEVPMAPGVGLYLDELYFEQYNWKQDNEREYLQTRNVVRTAKANNVPLRLSAADIRKSALAAVEAALSASAGTSTPAAESSVGGEADAVAGTKRKLEDGEASDDKLTAKDDTHGVDEAAAEEKDQGGGEDEIDDGEGTPAGGSTFITDLSTLGEPLRWSADLAVNALMQDFRENVLWPHIQTQEHAHLPFLYYLDHLRVKKYRYPKAVATTVPEPVAGESGGNGGTPAATRVKIGLALKK